MRIGVWKHQPAGFFDQAILDADGTLVPTTGQCKEGMDIAYDGTWGYHPLVISLANTARSRCASSIAPAIVPRTKAPPTALDAAIATCLTRRLSQGPAPRRHRLFPNPAPGSLACRLAAVSFIFGYDASANLEQLARELPENAWQKLERPPRYQAVTGLRHRPVNVKDRIVRERGFETLRLHSEEVAEFRYRPHACTQEYRMIVVRKNISKEKGEIML